MSKDMSKVKDKVKAVLDGKRSAEFGCKQHKAQDTKEASDNNISAVDSELSMLLYQTYGLYIELSAPYGR